MEEKQEEKIEVVEPSTSENSEVVVEPSTSENSEVVVESSTPENSEVVAETPTTEAVENNSNDQNQKIFKFTKRIVSFAFAIFIIMAIRMAAALISVGDINTFLTYEDEGIRKIGVLSLVELCLGVFNLGLSIANYALCKKMQNSILINKQAQDSARSAKIFSIILSVAFILFLLFEVIGIVFMIRILRGYGVNVGATTVSSLVFTGVYAYMACKNTIDIFALEKKIKKEENK